MRRGFALFFLSCFFVLSRTQPIDIYIDLDHADRGEAIVQMSLPATEKDSISFRFSTYFPGYYKPIFPERYVKDLMVVKQDTSSFSERNDVRNIIFKLDSVVGKTIVLPAVEGGVLQYTVRHNWHEESTFKPVSNCFSCFDDDYSLLQFPALLGRFEASDSILLIVNKEDELRFSSYKELLNAPTYLFPFRRLNFGQPPFDVLVSQIPVNHSSWSNQELVEMIHTAANTVQSYTDDYSLFYSKQVIVFLDSICTNQSSAISNPNGLTVHICLADIESDPEYYIYKTLIHEMLHWSPGLRPEFSQNRQNNLIQDLWFYEGVTEYLAHKIMTGHGLLTEVAFIEKMELKMRQAEKFKEIALSDMSSLLHTDNDSYTGFYSKGMLAAWLYDIRRLQYTESDVSLIEWIHSDSLKTINDVMESTYRELSNSKTFPYNSYLNELGILYEYQKYTIYHPLQDISIQETKNEQYFMSKIPNESLYMLEEKDMLLKVNGQKFTIGTWQTILSEIYTHDKIALKIIRAGKKKNITIELGKKKYRLSKHHLTFLSNRTDNQKARWEIFFK